MQLAISLVFLVLGVSGFLYVNRRVFYRRNVAGVQEFNGYGKMLIIRLFETAIRVVSLLFILASLGLLITFLIQ
jgi:hypothetical protein